MFGPETTPPVVETTIGSASHPYHFYCPDVAAVDQYLAALGGYLRSGACLIPERAGAVLRDIDRLLDRRLALMTTGPMAAPMRGPMRGPMPGPITEPPPRVREM
jgi:hypothetical protein